MGCSSSLITNTIRQIENINDTAESSQICQDNKRIKGTKIFDYGRYEGEMKEDKPDGKGIIYYNNGDKFEGELKEGFLLGKGTFYFSNGDIYEGDLEYFKEEKYTNGIFYYKDGDVYWRI